MRVVNVNLGKRSYPIKIGAGLLENLGRECEGIFGKGSCAIITDTNVGKLYAARAVESLSKSGFSPFVITIRAGESSKNLRVVERCYNELANKRVERRSFIVALGGGVVGDLAGFVAATYMRGIGFVQVPTTLLAQVDSSVGGKVGINLRSGKNLVGAFYQPGLVLCDLNTLSTLPQRELRAGLSEVIKYAVIYDEQMFGQLEKCIKDLVGKDAEKLGNIIARCCEIKADVVSQDETESGLRAILNFGHTIGHAIEAISGYKKYLHGEAVAIGQVAASHIATKVMGFAEADASRVKELLRSAGLPVSIKLTSLQKKRLFDAMRLDKKVSGGEIKFVLPEKIGAVKWGQKVPMPVIEEALDKLAQ